MNPALAYPVRYKSDQTMLDSESDATQTIEPYPKQPPI